jgi:2-acylglycerol O-acyltransferase 2
MMTAGVWIMSPGLLAGSAGAVGGMNGMKGLVAVGALTGFLPLAGSNVVRGLICGMITMIAAASKHGKRRVVALCGAGLMSLMTMVASRRKPFAKSQLLFDFVSRWGPDYYQKATLKFVDASDVRPGKSFFAWHPHGCLSAGWSINGVFNDDFMKGARARVHWLIDPILRHRSLFRAVTDAYEGEDREVAGCDSANFKKLMAASQTVCFEPGGYLEAVSFKHGVDSVVLSDRKAFIKLCLQFGYRLHPVYTFGECDTYYTVTGLSELRMKLARRNVPALAFFGWALIPFLPMPSASIQSYVGCGIEFPTIESPSSGDVDHWHSVYVGKLQELFDECKADAGKPAAQLQVL